MNYLAHKHLKGRLYEGRVSNYNDTADAQTSAMLAAYLLISAGATSAVVAAVGFSRQETSKLTLASNKQLPPYLAYLAAARTKIRSDVSRFALTPAVAGLAMSLRGGALSPRFSGKPAGSRKGHDFVEVASDDDFEGMV